MAPVLPGKLIKLGDGQYPSVLVDAAGTGQIAYSSNQNVDFGPSVVHDCVLLRGQTGCAASSGLVPPEVGDDPTYNIDEDGSSPLAIGNQMLMIDHRFPNEETLPDGTTGYPTFLWTSEDGGKTFTGPGTIGNLQIGRSTSLQGTCTLRDLREARRVRREPVLERDRTAHGSNPVGCSATRIGSVARSGRRGE